MLRAIYIRIQLCVKRIFESARVDSIIKISRIVIKYKKLKKRTKRTYAYLSLLSEQMNRGSDPTSLCFPMAVSKKLVETTTRIDFIAVRARTHPRVHVIRVVHTHTHKYARAYARTRRRMHTRRSVFTRTRPNPGLGSADKARRKRTELVG